MLFILSCETNAPRVNQIVHCLQGTVGLIWVRFPGHPCVARVYPQHKPTRWKHGLPRTGVPFPWRGAGSSFQKGESNRTLFIIRCSAGPSRPNPIFRAWGASSMGSCWHVTRPRLCFRKVPLAPPRLPVAMTEKGGEEGGCPRPEGDSIPSRTQRIGWSGRPSRFRIPPVLSRFALLRGYEF